jgi:SAM-dependent methyltransferase/YHS domain-containing protein
MMLTGVDISGAMVERAARRAARAGLSERVRFEVGDVAALPLSDEEFDGVVSTLSLRHWSDPASGLAEIHRVLKPGGEARIYDLAHSARNAQLLEEEYDLVVVHDPQPLALLRLHGKGAARWVWRCHIDTSEPNPQVWGFLGLNLEGYDATVFTLGNFAPPDVLVERVEIIPQAIDPESSKHFEGAQQPRTSVAKVGLMGEERDPVCGTRIEPRQASEYVYREHRYHFCSESCCEQFRATPEYFLRAMSYRS